jgi:hypothetical protein
MANVQEQLQKEIATLEAELASQLERVKRSQMLTIVIGAVLIVVILAYFSIMGGYVKDIMKPKDLAQMASTTVVGKLPELRATVDKEARALAPKLVDNAVDAVIKDQIPALRAEASKFVKEQSSARLNEFRGMVEGALDDLVARHSDNIKEFCAALETSEGRSAFENEMYTLINEALNDPEILVSLDSYKGGLENIENLLISISEKPEAELTDEERAVRNLVATVREISNRNTMQGPGLSELLKIPGEFLKKPETTE